MTLSITSTESTTTHPDVTTSEDHVFDSLQPATVYNINDGTDSISCTTGKTNDVIDGRGGDSGTGN